MEWSRLLREFIWRNAGFNSLRKIAPAIEDYEPWFEPMVVPIPDPASQDDDDTTDTNSAAPEPEPEPEVKDVDALFVYPQPDKYYSVADYRKLYLSGALTPSQVAEALLPLIRRDVPSPSEHSKAWFQTDIGKVLAAAKASTLRYQEKRSLGPLDGIPTAVKDEYDMDGYRTCLGSKNTYADPADHVPTTWCVQKLEAAGAVILGKLSMHEFGLDTTGNNPIHGTPRNPFNRSYYTGGSSSGTGYAVSTGLIPIGLGSDGGGSIRIPASMCSVFGLKPTHGRLSFAPGQNHSITCACLGPLAGDVDSLRTIFHTIAAPHPTSPFPPLPASLPPAGGGTTPIPLGIPTAWFSRATPAIQTACHALLRRLPSHYTPIPITLPFLPEGQTAHALTVLTDAATLLPTTSNLTPANRILLALGRATPATDYLLAQKLRRLLMQHLSHLFRQHPGLLIITPTTSCEGWPIRGGEAELRWGVNDGDQTLASMEYVWLANFCGLPSVSVPAGYVVPEIGEGEVPVGLMATGEWCGEEGLLSFAEDCERVGRGERRRPGGWVDVVGLARGVPRGM